MDIFMLPPFAAERPKLFITESQLTLCSCKTIVLIIISVEMISEIALWLDDFVWLQVGF